MPSGLRQKIYIVKNKKTGQRHIVIEKTGFLDLWYNGKHYYYNVFDSQPNADNIDIEKLIEKNARRSQKKAINIVRKTK